MIIISSLKLVVIRLQSRRSRVWLTTLFGSCCFRRRSFRSLLVHWCRPYGSHFTVIDAPEDYLLFLLAVLFWGRWWRWYPVLELHAKSVQLSALVEGLVESCASLLANHNLLRSCRHNHLLDMVLINLGKLLLLLNELFPLLLLLFLYSVQLHLNAFTLFSDRVKLRLLLQSLLFVPFIGLTDCL